MGIRRPGTAWNPSADSAFSTTRRFCVTNDRLMQCLPSGAQRYAVSNAPHFWYPANAGAGAQRIHEFIAGAIKR
jgi:hypothetical protein